MKSIPMLGRFEQWLAANRPDALATMNPGLDAASIGRFEAELGVSLPADVRRYFAWRDGQEHDTYECVPPGEWEFLSSRLVIANRAQMDRDHQGMSPNGSMDLREWWRPGFIPFLRDPSGGYMCLDSAGSLTGRRWVIVEFHHDTNDLVIRHASFAKWLQTTIETVEAGLFGRNDDGDVCILDRQEYSQLCRRINRGLPKTVPMVYR